MNEIFGEVWRIRGDEVGAIRGVNSADILLRVHALVECDGHVPLPASLHCRAELVDDRLEQSEIMPVALVFTVKEWQPGLSVHQQRQTNLLEPVPSFLSSFRAWPVTTRCRWT